MVSDVGIMTNASCAGYSCSSTSCERLYIVSIVAKHFNFILLFLKSSCTTLTFIDESTVSTPGSASYRKTTFSV